MEINALKYQIVKEIITLNDLDLLFTIKQMLSKANVNKTTELLSEFHNIWKDSEAEEIKNIILKEHKLHNNE